MFSTNVLSNAAMISLPLPAATLNVGNEASNSEARLAGSKPEENAFAAASLGLLSNSSMPATTVSWATKALALPSSAKKSFFWLSI